NLDETIGAERLAAAHAAQESRNDRRMILTRRHRTKPPSQPTILTYGAAVVRRRRLLSRRTARQPLERCSHRVGKGRRAPALPDNVLLRAQRGGIGSLPTAGGREGRAQKAAPAHPSQRDVTPSA